MLQCSQYHGDSPVLFEDRVCAILFMYVNIHLVCFPSEFLLVCKFNVTPSYSVLYFWSDYGELHVCVWLDVMCMVSSLVVGFLYVLNLCLFAFFDND